MEAQQEAKSFIARVGTSTYTIVEDNTLHILYRWKFFTKTWERVRTITRVDVEAYKQLRVNDEEAQHYPQLTN